MKLVKLKLTSGGGRGGCQREKTMIERESQMPELENIVTNLWKHFGKIAELPHGSGKEDPIRDYVYQFASGLNNVNVKFYEKNATEPGRRIIVLQKYPAKQPRFILQAHLDMVCTPSDMKFPLHFNDEGGWRSALDNSGCKSTLGADNGLGVAAALALLESDDDTGFECFFTVEEETTMGGAAAFDPGLLNARTLFNVDSEEVDTITYGCAGGRETHFSLPVAWEPAPPGTDYIELKISGLSGGHSAMCINMGRLNAIKTLIHCLKQLYGKYEFNLTGLNGGNAKNAIPMEAACGIIVAETDSVHFLQDLEAVCRKTAAHYKANEPNFHYQIHRELAPPQVMFSLETTGRIIETMAWLPHGVIKMDPHLPLAVMTSNNLGIAGTNQAAVTLCCFHRSSNPGELERVSQILETIGRFYSWEVIPGASFLPWAPNEASPLLSLVKEVYGPAAIVEVTHAGLECGHIYQKYNGAMDCVSIGPTIVDPHSVNERADINSVNIFMERLLKIINQLKLS
jgi:dipeptidase D